MILMDIQRQLFLNSLSCWKDNSVVFTRGGVSGNYTRKIFFDCEKDLKLYASNVVKSNYVFPNIYLITSGLCGSSCSQFSSKLRYEGKAVYIGLGGIYNQPMDTSGFAGGNVITLPKLENNAYFTYNWREAYINNNNVPREWTRIEPDIRIDNWDILTIDLLNDLGLITKTQYPILEQEFYENITKAITIVSPDDGLDLTFTPLTCGSPATNTDTNPNTENTENTANTVNPTVTVPVGNSEGAKLSGLVILYYLSMLIFG